MWSPIHSISAPGRSHHMYTSYILSINNTIVNSKNACPPSPFMYMYKYNGTFVYTLYMYNCSFFKIAYVSKACTDVVWLLLLLFVLVFILVPSLAVRGDRTKRDTVVVSYRGGWALYRINKHKRPLARLHSLYNVHFVYIVSLCILSIFASI